MKVINLSNGEIKTHFDSIIDKRYERYERLKRASGKIVEVLPRPINKCKVLVLNTVVTLLNKTGELLEENDSVWVYYWDNIANGYIAIKNGLTRRQLPITQYAAVYTPDQYEVYRIEHENPSSTYRQTLLNIDEKNYLEVETGANSNVFFVNGLPVFMNYSNISHPEWGRNNFPDWLENVNPKTIIKEANFLSYDVFPSSGSEGVLSEYRLSVQPVEIQRMLNSQTNEYERVVRVGIIGETSSGQYTALLPYGFFLSDYDSNNIGMVLLCNSFHVPDDLYPFGYTAIQIAFYSLNSNAVELNNDGSVYRRNYRPSRSGAKIANLPSYYIPFSSIDEYNFFRTVYYKIGIQSY